MKIIDLSINKSPKLKLLVDALKNGKIIAYPTETVYGLGCDATNRSAVQVIYDIKKREAGKPLLILVANLRMAAEYLEISKLAKRLAKEYWPGPLTLILPVKEDMRQSLGRETVGVRVSSHPLATTLVKKLKRPLISTSANPSGEQPATSVEDVVLYFSSHEPAPEILVDGGVLSESMPSTILDLSGPEPRLIREGALIIDLERLK